MKDKRLGLKADDAIRIVEELVVKITELEDDNDEQISILEEELSYANDENYVLQGQIDDLQDIIKDLRSQLES